MKRILRTFIFSYISIYLTQVVIGGLFFGGNYNITLFLILLALTLLDVFLAPILKLLGLPDKGPGGLFLAFLMNLIVFYMLTALIPFFDVTQTIVSELIIFGYVLPSKSLTKVQSLVLSALLYVLILYFFKWLCSQKSK